MVEENQRDKSLFDSLTQVAIPTLTVAVQVAIAMKLPQWGLLINMIAQPFWIFSAWKAYQKAGQIGLLVTTILVTFVIGLGLINYWII